MLTTRPEEKEEALLRHLLAAPHSLSPASFVLLLPLLGGSAPLPFFYCPLFLPAAFILFLVVWRAGLLRLHKLASQPFTATITSCPFSFF